MFLDRSDAAFFNILNNAVELLDEAVSGVRLQGTFIHVEHLAFFVSKRGVNHTIEAYGELDAASDRARKMIKELSCRLIIQ